MNRPERRHDERRPVSPDGSRHQQHGAGGRHGANENEGGGAEPQGQGPVRCRTGRRQEQERKPGRIARRKRPLAAREHVDLPFIVRVETGIGFVANAPEWRLADEPRHYGGKRRNQRGRKQELAQSVERQTKGERQTRLFRGGRHKEVLLFSRLRTIERFARESTGVTTARGPDVTVPLREELGFESLRPGQEEAVRAVIEGHDTLAVQPTGSGKSAIDQIAGSGAGTTAQAGHLRLGHVI